MATYSISQLIGKSVYAKEKLPLYKTTSSAKPFEYVMAGDFIGVVDSWISKDGKLWFLFKSNTGQYVVPYIAYSFDIKSLKEQGAKTVEQERKEKEEKELKNASPIEYYLRKYGIWAVGAIVAAGAANGLLSKKWGK